MSDSDERFIRMAIDTARLSTEHCAHGAVLVKSGQPQAYASNKFRNNPSVAYAGIRKRENRGLNFSTPASYHAEMSALRMVSEAVACNSVLYIARYTNSGTTGLSRPCQFCMEYILDRCVKKIVYTTGDGTYAIERTNKIWYNRGGRANE